MLFVAVLFGLGSPVMARHCDVQKGDSMYRIAKRYHIPFRIVIQLNEHYKNKNLIHPKDEIQLPDGSSGNETNKNSSGDNITDGTEKATERKETSQERAVLQLVNQERAKVGLPALTLNSNLSNVATIKAKDMAVNKYFDHNSPTYGTPFQMMQKFGIKYSYAGENIAAGQTTAQQVMNSWMNSSGHKANILNKNYTQIGIGFYTGGLYNYYWVQQFIKP